MLQKLVVFVAAPALVALATLHWWRTRDVGPAQRGARLALEHGCLGCHGPAGSASDPDGDRGIGAVPTFDHEDVTAYARSEAEIREWILDGKPRRLRETEGGEPLPLLRMPAFRGRLGDAEVDHLVAYVTAVSGFVPLPAPAAEGFDAATRLGCFSCHGPGGRFDTPNPGSLKGHIPSWRGRDFEELARDEGEIREWVRDGAPKRLRDHPAAAFFLRRQAIRMPAYGDRVTEAEIGRILAYIRWLRQGSSSSSP